MPWRLSNTYEVRLFGNQYNQPQDFDIARIPLFSIQLWTGRAESHPAKARSHPSDKSEPHPSDTVSSESESLLWHKLLLL